MRKQLLISLSILLFLFAGTTLVILYGKGYRFNLDKGRPDLSETGLLVTKSVPDGAQVFINGHLTTATDTTINLAEGEYTVKIAKEGYFSWEKKITIQKEVVSKAEALLLPSAPTLESITSTGVESPVIDPSITRIAFTVSSQSLRKNGAYILDMSARPVITLQSSTTQVVDDTSDVFSKAELTWSPDGQNILASVSASQKGPTTYELVTNSFNEDPKDVTTTIATIQDLWAKEKSAKDKARLDTLTPALQKMIAQNFAVVSWSPDETKILYIASQSATMPVIIKPRLIGVDSTPEERQIKKDSLYVYDIKEDKNFTLKDAKPLDQSESGTEDRIPLAWFPDSRHLIFVHEKKVDILEYDGANKTTVYAGPFIDNYVFPWPNGSKIVILTNLNNADSQPNLYTISLK